MKATEILNHEHRIIEQVLHSLDRLAEQAATTGQLNTEDARAMLDFFRNFADRCHHGKEEVHLFPMMEAKGFSREGGPTGVMLSEHEQGRALIRGMSEALDALEVRGQGDAAAIGAFTHHAHAYSALLSQHIQKEDHCLFAMADQAFSADDQRELLDRFEHVEAAEMGEGTHEKYLALADRLARTYGVPLTITPGPAASACPHHMHPAQPDESKVRQEG